jgi:DNA/RNA-binding domain of Phe-tRNA-synthetase-like protein
MKLVISDEIRAKYPDLRVGIVVANNIINSEYADGLKDYSGKMFQEFARTFSSEKKLSGIKNIIAWQNIYRSFGVNPKKKCPTAEALLSRVIRTGFVPCINPAVDSYLIAETLHNLPIGGYDLNKIDGDITLRFSPGGESFLGIGSQDAENTSPGEVIYSDYSRILTRRWNYRDCEYSKIDNTTTSLALFVEGPISEIQDAEIRETILEISSNLGKYCNATTKELFLDKTLDEIEIL